MIPRQKVSPNVNLATALFSLVVHRFLTVPREGSAVPVAVGRPRWRTLKPEWKPASTPSPAPRPTPRSPRPISPRSASPSALPPAEGEGAERAGPACPRAVAAARGAADAGPGRALPVAGGDGRDQGQCRSGRGAGLRRLARRPVRHAAGDLALGLAGPGRLRHRRHPEQPAGLRSRHVAPAHRQRRSIAPARRHGPARFPRRRHRRGQRPLAAIRGRRLCRSAARQRVRQFPRPCCRRSRPTSRWAII